MNNQNQSQEELINELKKLKQELDSLKATQEKESAIREQTEKDIADWRKIKFDLNKRLKELKCHNKVSEIMSNSDLSTDEVCTKIVHVIPESWQFPEAAVASIRIHDKVYFSPDFKTSKYSMLQEIKVNKEPIGHIEVCYLENRLPHFDQIFLKEETSLLFSVAERIGNFVEKKEKEQALKSTERKYRDLVENLNDTIYEVKTDGTILYLNPVAERVLGYSLEELLGKSLFDLVLEEDRPLLIERISSKKIPDSTYHEYRFISKTGEIRWLRKSTAVIIQDGEFISKIGTLTDITEQKLSEERILKANRLYAVISQINQAIVRIKNKEELLKEICRIAVEYGKFRMAWTGIIDEEEQIVKPFAFQGFEDGYLSKIKSISISDVPEGRGPTGTAIRDGKYFVCNDIETDPRMQVWRKEALKRGYRSSIALPLRQSGKVFGALSLYASLPYFFTDEEIKLLCEITDDINFAIEAIDLEYERDETLKALLDSQNSLKKAQEIAKLGSWVEKKDGKMIWSDEMFRILGISPENYKPDPEFLQKCIKPEDQQAVHNWMNSHLAGDAPDDLEFRIIQPEGKERVVICRAKMVYDSECAPLLFTGTLQDITERKKAERALYESEERIRQIIEQTQTVIWEIDASGKFTYVSPLAKNVWGYSPEELIGKEYYPNLHPREDRERQKKVIDEAFSQKGSLINMEWRIQTPDQRIIWVNTNAVPILDEANNLIGFRGSDNDITARKLAEEKIKQQNERLNAIINIIPDLIFVINEQGTFTEFYSSAPGSISIDENQIIGKNIRDKFDEQGTKIHLKNIQECIQQNKLVTYEYSTFRNNSNWFFEVRLTPMKNRQTLCFVRDITESKQKNIELRQLSQAVEQSPVGIIITDRNANMIYVNRAFLQTTGYSYPEVLGKNTSILKSGQNAPETYSDLWHTITSGKEWQGEWINKKKNGERYWEHVSISPVHDESGEITNYLAIKQDISQRKQAEQEIQELNANLEIKIRERTAQLAEANTNLLEEIEERKKIENALLVKSKELENFFSITPDLLCIADSKGNFIRVNKAWEDILGYSASDLEHKCFLDFIHADDIQTSLNLLRTLNNRQSIHNLTTRYKTKDGSYRFIEWDIVKDGNLFYSAARDITERKRANDFEKELLQLSPKLTGVTLEKIDSALNLALLRIGQILHADRAYIFELDQSERYVNNTYEWCNKEIEPQIQNMQNIPVEVYPTWMKILLTDENVIIPSAEDLPDTMKQERELLEPQGIKSLILIPMQIESKFIGFVGLDSVVTTREYSITEINILKVWSNMLASLINNQRSESLLEQARQNFETFFNTIDDFVFVLNQDGNIIQINNTVKDRLGYSFEELENKTILTVHPPEYQKEAQTIADRTLLGSNDSFDIPLLTKTGKHIPVETKVKRGFWNGQQVIFGVSKDISQIKLSEQKFASAFQASSVMMVISLFEDGRFIDVNNTFLESLGYSRDEIIGKKEKDFEMFVDRNTRTFLVEQLKQNKPVQKHEVQIRTRTGEIRYGLISADTIYVGQDRCLLTVNLDITERKKIEDELRKAQAEADQANLAKSEFLSRMSHELRTPMNSILGFAQLLLMGELTSSQSKSVNHILKSGKHLLDLINEALDISRIEAGRLSLSIEPVELSGVISEMIGIVLPQAKERHLTLDFVNSPSNHLFIKSDRQRLRQVLLNLLNNAIKYNKEGGSVIITTDPRPPKGSGVKPLRISVSDTGLGIPAKDIPKLFNPFERIGAEKTGTEGTGLGLSVVKKLIEAMGGTLGVESFPDIGSTFWIELPLCENQTDTTDQVSEFFEQKLRTENKTGTILYIEDNISNIELVEQILSNQFPDIRLITSTNGNQAMKLAEEHSPGLILLDLNLPDIHGQDVLEYLQANEQTKTIPVVVISADTMPQQMERMLHAGVREYLTKPLVIHDFMQIIDRFFPDHNV